MSDDLSQKQQSALAELKRGATFKVAAQAAGVTRITLYRWVKSDPDFRAAYNAWEQEKIESARARLVRASGKAVERVVRSVEVDPKLAMKLLKELGVFNPHSAGPINLEHVRQQIELEMKAQEPPSDLRVKRLGVAVSEQSDVPRLTAMPTLLGEPNHVALSDKTRESLPAELKSAPQQSAMVPEVSVPQRSSDEISVGSCPDEEDWDDDQDQG